MTSLELQLADIQGRLFELAARKGLPGEAFAKAFMTGHVAQGLDSTFNRYQWAGEEYLLEEVEDAAGEALVAGGRTYSPEAMYWAGYLYRYWHILTGESSAKIYRAAPAAIVLRNYPALHTLDPALAIEDLRAISRSKQRA